MADGAIGTTHIAEGSITAAKISGGTGVWVGNRANIYHDAGNVGIGTTAPNLKLQVNGSLGARGPTATDGYIDMQPGSTTYAGYLKSFKPGPLRLAYLGYAAGGINNLGLNLESAAFNINGGNVGIGLGPPTRQPRWM